MKYSVIDKECGEFIKSFKTADEALNFVETKLSENLDAYEIHEQTYSERVQELEFEGCTTSDAQSIADIEYFNLKNK